MIQAILSNMAIILLGHLLMSTFMDYKERLSKGLVFIGIVFLFSGVIIALFYLPIQFGEYGLDLRLIPLMFLAWFRGWKITIPVLIIVSSWRLFMGDDGAIFGVIFGMAIPTLFILSLSKRNKSRNSKWKMLFILTISWFISDIPIIFFLPNGMEIFKSIYLIRYVSFLAVAIIYYSFILLAYRNDYLKRELEFLACHDSLTGLLNRNRFIEIVEEEMTKGETNHFIAMIDIDHFKEINDTYGHLAGDRVLIELSAIFKKYQSEDVMIARYGGEEFIIYQRTNNTKQAVATIEKIQNEIRATSFQLDDELSVTVTVSIGLAKFEKNSRLQDSIKQADDNLYKAKELNRDQLVVNFATSN